VAVDLDADVPAGLVTGLLRFLEGDRRGLSPGDGLLDARLRLADEDVSCGGDPDGDEGAVAREEMTCCEDDGGGGG
jgi:hypothetical protein